MKALEMRELREEKLSAGAAGPLGARVVIGAAVVAGIALRFANLGRNSLWFDEGYTAWAVSHPVGEVVRIIKADTAPPLYYILLRGWTHLFGFSEAGLRSMSALMACIALLVFVAIARRLLRSAYVAAAAVVLFSFSFFQIGYAHDARFYAMMTMLEAIDVYLVLLVCERSTPIRLAGLCVAWIASLYTNNMMVVYLGCLGVGWLLLPGRRPLSGRLKDAAIVSVITAIAFAPWLPTLVQQSKRIQAGFWPSVPDAVDLERTISYIAGVNDQSLPSLHWRWHTLNVTFLEVNLLLIGLALLACTSGNRLRRVGALFIIGIKPILLIFMYSHLRQSIFMERAFVGSGVAAHLLAVFALESVRSKAAKIFSLGAVLLLAYMTFRSLPLHRLGEHSEDWRSVCRFINSSDAQHRLVICVSSDGEPLYRYYGCQRDYGPRSDVTAVPRSFFTLDPPQTMQRVKSDHDMDCLRERLDRHDYDEVVLISSHGWFADPDERTLEYLSTHFAQTDEKQFERIRVFRYKPFAPEP